jgi:predicted metal-dependent hydrolase
MKAPAITIKGAQVPVELERRKGSRHLRLRLGHQNQLRVTLPWNCPERTAWAFVEDQREWIERQLAEAPPALELSAFLDRQRWVSVDGQRCSVQLSRSWRSVDLGWRLVDGVGPLVLDWPLAADEADLKQIVRSFAKKALFARLLDQATRLHIQVPKLTVRDQASRWGSCSASARISLNWRLLLLAPELQDYIILHELAHLAEMNHSKRFWALLERYDPDRRAHEAALDACGRAVMRVGR